MAELKQLNTTKRFISGPDVSLGAPVDPLDRQYEWVTKASLFSSSKGWQVSV